MRLSNGSGLVPAIAHAAQHEDVLRSLWEKTARAGTTRHPFHREVLTDLNTLLDNVAAAARCPGGNSGQNRAGWTAAGECETPRSELPPPHPVDNLPWSDLT